MITAIGTGIGDEFDIAKLRYHRDDRDDRRRRRRLAHPDADPHVPLPATCRSSSSAATSTSPCRRSTASSSAAARRTSRRRPSSRRCSSASASRTSRSPTRGGQVQQLTEARWARFTRALSQFEGWAGSCAPTSATRPRSSSSSRRLIEQDVDRRPTTPTRAVAARDLDGYTVEVLDHDEAGFRVKVIETETSAATLRHRAGRAARVAELRGRFGAPTRKIVERRRPRRRSRSTSARSSGGGRDLRRAARRGARPRQGRASRSAGSRASAR